MKEIKKDPMPMKKYCPILTIGFNPPKEGKRDPRVCMKDCAWYNPEENTCAVTLIAETISSIEVHASDISDYTADMMSVTAMELESIYGYSEGPSEDEFEPGRNR